jgi:signal peptidase I
VGSGKIALLAVVGFCLGVPAVVFLIVVGLMLSGVTHVYSVPTAAMTPTLRATGEHVFSIKYAFGHPGRSNIIAFKAPARAAQVCGRGGVYVARIVGMPGETWQEQKGRVYIDDRLLVEPYVDASERDRLTKRPVKIPAGSYFVMGDNRSDSCDSRAWGPLPRRDIVGRVIATYWPPSRIALH